MARKVLCPRWDKAAGAKERITIGNHAERQAISLCLATASEPSIRSVAPNKEPDFRPAL